MSVPDAVRDELALLTVDDLCDLWKVDRSWVYRHVGQGLPFRRMGRLLRFHPEEVKTWLAAQS